MAIERIQGILKQRLLIEASKEAASATQTEPGLIREGNIEQYEAIREAGRQRVDFLLGQVKEVDRLFGEILLGFKKSGIEDPSVEEIYAAFEEELKVREQVPPLEGEPELEPAAKPEEPRKKPPRREPSVAVSEEPLPSLMPEPKDTFGAMTFLAEEQSVEVEDKRIQLDAREWDLLTDLVLSVGEKVSGEDLTNKIFGSDGLNRSKFTQTVYTLRKKLGESAKEQRFIRSEGRGPAGTLYWYQIIEAESDEKNGPEESVEVGSRLTDNEIYRLARSIKEDRGDLVAGEEDRARIEQILTKYEPEGVSAEDIHEIQESLSGKLKSFFENKEEVFDANSENEDAQFLLAAIAVLETEEEQKKLAGEEKNSDDENGNRYFDHELFRLDRPLHGLLIDGDSVDLTLKEFEVLELLLKNQGKLLTIEDFNREVWKFDDTVGLYNLLKNIIVRLRSKIKHGRNVKVPIKNVRGAGYIFED